MQTDGILFDLDGTLWDSADEVAASWNRVIARFPGLRSPITRQEQTGIMGLQMDEIARRIFPDQSDARRAALMKACTEEENQYLRRHGAKLYPGVPETLSALHELCPLLIVSNCQSGYIEAFLEAHGLSPFIDAVLCFGDTGCSKAENIQTMVERYRLQQPVYVGDTSGDQKASDAAGVPFVYAAYGFGNVTDAALQIASFPDLLKYFPVPQK